MAKTKQQQRRRFTTAGRGSDSRPAWVRGGERYRRERAEAERVLPALVREARATGATWDEIGAVVGLSRQVLTYRYGPAETLRPRQESRGR